jgi:hypothetical protein
MAGNWRESYRSLQEFIGCNNGIKIDLNSIIISGDARLKFYSFFEDVNAEYVRERFAPELLKARMLSDNWQKLSDRLTMDLGLLSIDVPLYLKWFLADPLDGLTRTLFEPLLDLIRGKMGRDGFESVSMETIKHAFDRYYSEGYRRWVIIALIKILSPDRLLEVKGQDLYNESSLSGSGGGVGAPSGEAPQPIEARTVSFIEAPVHAFLTPKIIVHSTRLNKYVSLRSDFHESLWNSRTYSSQQEWLYIPEKLYKSDKSHLWPDLVIHLAPNAKDLCLLADYSHIARPAVSLEVRESTDWYEKERVDNIKRHADFLKPKRGSFVACCEAIQEKAMEEFKDTVEPPLFTAPGMTGSDPPRAGFIKLLTVNYDPARLEPVVEALGG